jgi:hypothetical protein
MKEKEKSDLAEKAKEKVERLRTIADGDSDVTVSLEVRKNLETALEAYLVAKSHLDGSKQQYEAAKANEAVASEELRHLHKHVKKLLKKQTGAQKANGKKSKMKKG